jgi:DNA-binding NarL/FixJ family response regulator
MAYETPLNGRRNGQLSAVLLALDRSWRELVERSLAEAGITLVGEAESPARAVKLVERHHPQMLVAEVDLEVDDETAVLRRFKEQDSDLRIIVVADSDEADRVAAAFEAGAVAYVVKSSRQEGLELAIRQAFHHSVFLATDRRVPAADRSSTTSTKLTPRERETLEAVATGLSNAEVARGLCVTEQTVKFHLANIYRKLDVPGRAAAVRWVESNGISA